MTGSGANVVDKCDVAKRGALAYAQLLCTCLPLTIDQIKAAAPRITYSAVDSRGTMEDYWRSKQIQRMLTPGPMKENHTHCSYHGELIKSRVVRDLPLVEAVYSPNLELPSHSHRHAGFCLVLKGGYTES